MRRLKKIFKFFLYVIGIFLLLLICFYIYVKIVSNVKPPYVADKSALNLKRVDHGNGFYTIGNNWFRHSKSGLFELYVEGKPFERGVINGKLTQELVVRQEEHFAEQIFKMIPSGFSRGLLKDMIGFFNRNLNKYVTEEDKEEIYGISESASPAFQYLGTNYQRILNYHAAHDIGHAVQNLALVGCTSFATWGSHSADSSMIMGRNFDFWVGDKFSDDKIVAFFNPSTGHKFMIVTWGGFIGAVSGMNDHGLAVTINAAKSDIPTSSATPVSLVTREILQYAGNIEQAIAIAKKRKMFVSESFLVASAADRKAVIIEKTPNDLDVYDPHQNYILCTNHFQGKGLANSKKNQQQIAESASEYRYLRLKELVDADQHNTVPSTVAILRDRKGLHGNDIGEGNEKAINQMIAHHSVVFEPEKGLVWVSTAPWQLGEYVAYDLNKIFGMKGLSQNQEVIDSLLTIPPDSYLKTDTFRMFEKYRKYKQDIADGKTVVPDSIVASNPDFYNAYVLAADYAFKNKQYAKALKWYEMALTKVIATQPEEQHIRKQMQKISQADK